MVDVYEKNIREMQQLKLLFKWQIGFKLDIQNDDFKIELKNIITNEKPTGSQPIEFQFLDQHERQTSKEEFAKQHYQQIRQHFNK